MKRARRGTLRRKLEDVMRRASYCDYEWTTGELANRLCPELLQGAALVSNTLSKMKRSGLVRKTKHKNDYDNTSKYYWKWNKEKHHEQSDPNNVERDW